MAKIDAVLLAVTLTAQAALAPESIFRRGRERGTGALGRPAVGWHWAPGR